MFCTERARRFCPMKSPSKLRCVAHALLFILLSLDAQALEIRGTVVNPDGSAVHGAVVRVDEWEDVVTTDEAGAFRIELDNALLPSSVEVSLPGYLSRTLELTETSTGQLRIVLQPVVLRDELTVTAARTPLRIDETAASVVVISKAELDFSAGATLDDALRQVPGFTLFRRSGSRVANPTTQGVSLRGVGASGAGRALVLDDGIPLNDPFGGWIFWGRVPREGLERVEILRGGGSDLYGSGALGGVVQMLRQRPSGASVSMHGSYGEDRTPELSLFAGFGADRWSGAVSAEAFATDGYILVAEDQRGTVDTRADSERVALDVTLRRTWVESGNAFLRLASFEEERGNGTPLQTNDTRIRQVSGGGDLLIRNAFLTSRFYTSSQTYDQSFTAISADRSTETLTRIQRVPSEADGANLQLTSLSGAHTIVAGFDVRSVEGLSDERGFGFTESFSSAGGNQTSLGAYLEDVVRLSNRFSLTAGLRYDTWRNHGAAREVNGEVVPLQSREEDAWSPRLSAVYRASDRWALLGSAYRAFRAPTLNELYRGFRVGNVLTEPNENLGAERLTGFEGGLVFTAPEERARMRGTLFWIEIDDPIANVTLDVTPSLITRRRENLGGSRSRGVELESEARIGNRWFLNAGYLHVRAEVVESSGSEELEGARLPQVPENVITSQIRYHAERFTSALQARWSDEQFDDDRNELRLGSFLTFDALVSVPVRPDLDVVASVENLLDERYDVGRTPVLTIGPPRSWRIGIRARWSRGTTPPS